MTGDFNYDEEHSFICREIISREFDFSGTYEEFLEFLGTEDSENLRENFAELVRTQKISQNELGSEIQAKLEEQGRGGGLEIDFDY